MYLAAAWAGWRFCLLNRRTCGRLVNILVRLLVWSWIWTLTFGQGLELPPQWLFIVVWSMAVLLRILSERNGTFLFQYQFYSSDLSALTVAGRRVWREGSPLLGLTNTHSAGGVVYFTPGPFLKWWGQLESTTQLSQTLSIHWNRSEWISFSLTYSVGGSIPTWNSPFLLLLLFRGSNNGCLLLIFWYTLLDLLWNWSPRFRGFRLQVWSSLYWGGESYLSLTQRTPRQNVVAIVGLLADKLGAFFFEPCCRFDVSVPLTPTNNSNICT